MKGTRTPVRSIVGDWQTYNGDLKEVQRALAHLNLEQIEAALAYYRDHTAEIDAHIERHLTALRNVHAA